MKINRTDALLALVVLLSVLLGWTLAVGPQTVHAADGEGALTLVNARAEGYVPDRQTAAPYRANLDGTDVVTDMSDPTTVTAEAPFELSDTESVNDGVRQNLPVSVRFSDSGDTADVVVGFYYFDATATPEWKFLGFDEPIAGGVTTTINASTVRESSGGAFTARTYVFDSYAATHAIVLVTGITGSGTVDLHVGSF